MPAWGTLRSACELPARWPFASPASLFPSWPLSRVHASPAGLPLLAVPWNAHKSFKVTHHSTQNMSRTRFPGSANFFPRLFLFHRFDRSTFFFRISTDTGNKFRRSWHSNLPQTRITNTRGSEAFEFLCGVSRRGTNCWIAINANWLTDPWLRQSRFTIEESSSREGQGVGRWSWY